MEMDPVGIGAIIGVIALALVAVWLFRQRSRSERLHARYGREYDRTVDELGRRRAEAELVGREQRVEQLDIRALTREQRDRFALSWRDVQAQFVDDPQGAVTQGSRLIEDVMEARGYPVSDFDQRVADLSVHHGRVVENYRAARDIARRHRRGEASTEDLRQAMVYYRNLFEDLLADREMVSERVVDRKIAREEARDIRDRPEPRPRTDREVRP
ncbi:MAG: hypothetical protein ACT4R6_14675 [Gemmatimonadaceae bacterium]